MRSRAPATRGRPHHPRAAQPASTASFGLLIVAALGGCGGDGGPPSAEVVVDTVEGVIRLTHGEAPGPALGWTVDTVAVIGEVMGEEEYQFGRLSEDAVAGDGAGHVLVLDRQLVRVLEYGPDGRHVATYGRQGNGPGELSFPGSLDLGPGDTLWVTDMVNRRLTGYPRAGGDPRTIPYPDASSFPSAQVEAVPGAFLQSLAPFGPPEEGQEDRGEPLVRFDADLRPLDTLWTAPPEPSDVVQMELGGQGIVLRMASQFWPAFEWRALSDGSVVVADTVDYLLRVLDGDGTLRRVIRRDPPARATTEADREAVRQRVLAEADSGRGVTFGSGGPDREAQRRIAEERVSHMSFADRIPRIRGLRIDPADRIWVGVAADTAPAEVGRIDIYHRDGRLLGELHDVPLPAAFAGHDRLVSVWTDELGVPRLVVMQVPEMAAGDRDEGAESQPRGGP